MWHQWLKPGCSFARPLLLSSPSLTVYPQSFPCIREGWFLTEIQHEVACHGLFSWGWSLCASLLGWDPAPYLQSASWESAGKFPGGTMALGLALPWMPFLEMLQTWTMVLTRGDRSFPSWLLVTLDTSVGIQIQASAQRLQESADILMACVDSHRNFIVSSETLHSHFNHFIVCKALSHKCREAEKCHL